MPRIIYQNEKHTNYLETIAQKIIDILKEENLTYGDYEAILSIMKYISVEAAKF